MRPPPQKRPLPISINGKQSVDDYKYLRIVAIATPVAISPDAQSRILLWGVKNQELDFGSCCERILSVCRTLCAFNPSKSRCNQGKEDYKSFALTPSPIGLLCQLSLHSLQSQRQSCLYSWWSVQSDHSRTRCSKFSTLGFPKTKSCNQGGDRNRALSLGSINLSPAN